MKSKIPLRSRKLGIATTAACLALGLAAPAVRAQSVNSGVSIGPSEALSPPGAAAHAPIEHLLGDPGGVRTRLENRGINLTLDWTAEVAGNVTGGTKKASSYAGQIGFEADVDWEKLAGIPGLSTHVVIVNRQGTNVGSAFGDNLNQHRRMPFWCRL